MQERKGTLPGIKNASKKKTSLEGIKNAENNRSSSALPIMQYFGKVQPSRRIVKADGSIRQESPWKKPTTSNILKPGFSGNMRTSYNPVYRTQAYKSRLDSYAGAAAAYSLRKLYSSYTGSAINVRRSSDNATQDIGFDGYVLDTASLLSFVGAGNGYVTTWYDQSGNGNDATQSTAASQPQIVSGGNVITENGKPTVSFDGSNDQMNVAYSFSNTSISHILVNSYDKDLQTSTYPHFFSGVNTNNANRLYAINKASLYYYSSGAGASLGSTTGVYGSNIDNSLNIISLSLRNSGAGYSGDFNLNGNSQVAFSNGNVPLQSFTSQILGNWNGTSGNTKMNVSEFIQFSSDESANLSGINSLINTYYNIY